MTATLTETRLTELAADLDDFASSDEGHRLLAGEAMLLTIRPT